MKEMRCGGDPVSLRADWFTGPLMAGFECTSYRRRDGVRLDVQASTRHDRLAEQDYKLVSRHGMRCVRDGIVWHRIERLRGCYDWSHLDRMVDGAEKSGVRVMWDFLHFGWPDWTHPLERSFVERFAEFSARAVDRISPHDSVVPINEISFLAWAAGDEGFMHPHFVGQGDDMKRALCAAFIASAKAIRTAVPTMPIMCAEPLIAVIADGPEHLGGADAAHEAQFQALDIILGRKSPYLGGSEDLIDVVGVNHYPHSQWLHPSRMPASPPIPLSDMLVDMNDRYERPLFLAETGCEGEDRPIWFTYAAEQLETANRAGADVRALCLYPILNHLGWEDDRYCPNGLFCGVGGDRVIYRPLADAIAQWRTRQRPTELHLTHAVIDA